MYSHEKNISRTFELYERFLSLKLDGRAILDYFALLKGTTDGILLYHPLSCDAQTRKTQWEDFLVVKFLFRLDNNLKVVLDHLLASDSIPTLSNALSRVLYVAIGSSESSSSFGTTTESSAMIVRGWGHSSSRGRGDLGRGSNTSTNSRYCNHYLLHHPVANSATLATSSSSGAFVPSHYKSWMLNSGATISLHSHFSTLSTSQNSLTIHLVDGSYSPISGFGTVQPIDYLTLTNLLFAPKFPVNLLSVSQLTKKHNCSDLQA
ncbi:UNVERIFIED_CONTAM: hypothetical protein Sradi_3235000 [Sesamum radiatum]|uniref:Retrovirus-related Pol polyprotein from transposon TNT 1-94-like beta-barrel domain-containing protein n=1 Tax=Sesamum radiatum TaxID=300843 RepID=A0AAW2RGE2_SESRA